MKTISSIGFNGRSTSHARGQIDGYRCAGFTVIMFSLIFRMGGTLAATTSVITRPTLQILPNVQIITVRPPIPVITPAPGMVDSVNTQADAESNPTPLGITVDTIQFGGDRDAYIRYEEYKFWDGECSCWVTRFRPASTVNSTGK